VARLTRAATNPSLPVVRSSAPRLVRPRRVTLAPRAALATAAVLAVALLSARLLPMIAASSLGKTAASLNPVSSESLSFTGGPRISQYALVSGYASATSALATSGWLVYSVASSSRGSLLLAENRKTKQTISLVSAPTAAPITVRALTDHWAIWSAGDGTAATTWRLYASRLPANGTASAPLLLVDSAAGTADTPVVLGGISAGGDTVLVAARTSSDSGVVLRLDLSSGTPVASVVARVPGHLLTDPSTDGVSYYWADVWFDGATGLHSTIWRGDSSGATEQVSADDDAFDPQVAPGTLAWVVVPRAALASAALDPGGATPDTDEALLRQLSGSLQARNLDSGKQWQVSTNADVTSLQAGGSLLLWQSGNATHAYDLRGQAPAPVDADVRGAALAGATSSAVVWETSAMPGLYVYDTK
jgi:hypothetical protein